MKIEINFVNNQDIFQEEVKKLLESNPDKFNLNIGDQIWIEVKSHFKNPNEQNFEFKTIGYLINNKFERQYLDRHGSIDKTAVYYLKIIQ